MNTGRSDRSTWYHNKLYKWIKIIKTINVDELYEDYLIINAGGGLGY